MPGYMSPKVLFAQSHSYPSDYFALEVIAFEFLNGVTPYRGGIINKYKIE